jgi:nicotinamide-nucleotide amidase
VEETIRQRLGELVFGADAEELHDAVAGLLMRKRLTLAVAEGVTGGTLAQSLVRVPGSSAWFVGGLIAYSNRLKAELLGVPQALLDAKGAVSPELALAMAEGCRSRLQSDLAVSTVGWAGPGDASERPAGQVYVGLAWQGGSNVHAFTWPGTRVEVQHRCAKMALNRVRLHLLRG